MRHVKELLAPNLIVSPSHEALLPNVPPENVVAMAEAAAGNPLNLKDGLKRPDSSHAEAQRAQTRTQKELEAASFSASLRLCYTELICFRCQASVLEPIRITRLHGRRSRHRQNADAM